MEFVNGHFDNTLTAIDESNIWWTVFSDACKGMNVDYETEIFPGKLFKTPPLVKQSTQKKNPKKTRTPNYFCMRFTHCLIHPFLLT